jgi:general secretion pathway protein G
LVIKWYNYIIDNLIIYFMNNNRKAFTLIELLVVIAIIGVLATLATISLSNSRAKARDAKRVADIRQVQTALELFFNDNNRYPTANEWNAGSILSTSSDGDIVYMLTIPEAPSPADGGCDSATNSFVYTTYPDGTSYTLSYCLGGKTGDLTSGSKCANPMGTANEACLPLNACDGVSSVSYSGQTYNTVAIGDQCWFKENLNVGTRVDAGGGTCIELDGSHSFWSCLTDDGTAEKYCYDNDDNNCVTYGGLYEWAEALNLPYTCNYAAAVDNGDVTYTVSCAGSQTINATHQGLCPTGWHVPSYADQELLAQAVDDDPNCTFGSCSTAGLKLKTVSWGGTDEYEFSALPAGFRDMNYPGGNFFALESNNYLWSTKPGASGLMAWYSELTTADDFNAQLGGRMQGASVRCLQD